MGGGEGTRGDTVRKGAACVQGTWERKGPAHLECFGTFTPGSPEESVEKIDTFLDPEA